MTLFRLGVFASCFLSLGVQTVSAQSSGELGCYADRTGVCSDTEIQCDSISATNAVQYGGAISRLCDAVNELDQAQSEREQCLTACSALVVQYNHNVHQYNENIRSTQALLKRYEALMAKAQKLKQLCTRKSCKKIKL